MGREGFERTDMGAKPVWDSGRRALVITGDRLNAAGTLKIMIAHFGGVHVGGSRSIGGLG